MLIVSTFHGMEGGWRPKRPGMLPRKPLNAFIMHMQEQRIALEFNYFGADDGIRAIADAWRAMSAEHKRKYEDMALVDIQRYNRQINERDR